MCVSSNIYLCKTEQSSSRGENELHEFIKQMYTVKRITGKAKNEINK